MQHFILTYGYLAVFILMVAESACIPVPSELIMPLGGALAAGAVTGHHLSLALVILASMAGNVVGSYLAWIVGRYGGSALAAGAGGSGCASTTSRWPTAGSIGTGRGPCSSVACCRWSGRSSRCRRVSPGCGRSGSGSTPRSAASRGQPRWPWPGTRSGRLAADPGRVACRDLRDSSDRDHRAGHWRVGPHPARAARKPQSRAGADSRNQRGTGYADQKQQTRNRSR